MSQLNKSHSTRNLILFIIIFAIVACGATYYLINQKLTIRENLNVSNGTNTAEENVTKVKLEDDGIKGIDDIYETYMPNDLKIIRYAYYDQPRSDDLKPIDNEESLLLDVDSTQYRINVYYIQIDGLKNENVQEKINKKLKRDVLEKIKNYKDEEYEALSIWSNAIGNFANTLSVCIYENIDVSEEDFKFYSYGLNFDLNTGREIQFKDLFTYNAGIKNLLTHYAYQSLALADYSAEGYADMDEVDYSEIEDNVFKIVQKYNENPDIDFYFAPNTITAIINEKEISIPMVECMEQIAIYHRYSSNKNLFKETSEYDTETNVFIPNEQNDYYYQITKRISDNLWVYVQIEKGYYDLDISDERIEILNEDFQEMFDSIQYTINDYESLDDGKSRFYEISAYNYKPDSDIKYEINEVCFEGDSEYCENTFFPWVIKQMSNGIEGGFIYEGELDKKMKKHLEVQENNVYRDNDYIDFEEYQEEYEEDDDFEPTDR